MKLSDIKIPVVIAGKPTTITLDDRRPEMLVEAVIVAIKLLPKMVNIPKGKLREMMDASKAADKALDGIMREADPDAPSAPPNRL